MEILPLTPYWRQAKILLYWRDTDQLTRETENATIWALECVVVCQLWLGCGHDCQHQHAQSREDHLHLDSDRYPRAYDSSAVDDGVCDCTTLPPVYIATDRPKFARVTMLTVFTQLFSFITSLDYISSVFLYWVLLVFTNVSLFFAVYTSYNNATMAERPYKLLNKDMVVLLTPVTIYLYISCVTTSDGESEPLIMYWEETTRDHHMWM